MRELYFNVVAEIIDATVPELAPDLHRMLENGIISAEEWANCKNVIMKPEARTVFGLLFKAKFEAERKKEEEEAARLKDTADAMAKAEA